jgi:hypothetical protein
MINRLGRRQSVIGWLLVGMLSSSCNRAPSFDILGSFFPAWLMCLALGLLLTVPAHWVLSRSRVALVFPILTYPSLTLMFTFAIWLTFFR